MGVTVYGLPGENADSRAYRELDVIETQGAKPLPAWALESLRRDGAANSPDALHRWLREHVVDVDEPGLVRSPTETLAVGRGDCKSLTALTLSAAKALGLRAFPSIWGTDGECFHHVAAYVEYDGDVVLIDGRATRAGVLQEHAGRACRGA